MTIRDLLEKNAAKNPDLVAMTWHEGKVWQVRTWKEYLARVRDYAEGYGTRFQLKPREDNVALLLGNSPSWIEAYIAQAGAGVAVVPVDPKLHEAELEYIFNDAEVRVITTDKAHIKMMMSLAPKLKTLRGIVIVDGAVHDGQTIGDVPVVAIDKLRISGGGAWYDANVATSDDVASIIYTSGTTGKPKGAMLTHRNFVSDIEGAIDSFCQGRPEGRDFISLRDSLFVVLPLFHAFSFTTNFVLSHFVGCRMCFCESLRTVSRDIKELKPTILMAVPLLCEKLVDKIQDGLAKSKVARTLMAIGLRGPVMHMVRLKLGGHLRLIITGGAPCPKRIIEQFHRLHVGFFEGYGLTECAPVVSVTTYGSMKVGTIGKPCHGVDIRIANPNEMGVGELQVKGANVMKGYFHNKKATAEAFDGEWLMTGDLASVDGDGDISIRGRKKALIVNREGKNIYPEEVEIAIAKDPVVRDVVVVGYTQGGEPGERVGAICYPNEEFYTAQNHGTMPDWDFIEKDMTRRVQERSAELADYKRVRKVVVNREPLERTSIGKVRRVTYKGTIDEP